MQVHVATVGKSADPIVNGFRHHSVDYQILLHSRETRDIAKLVMKRIDTFVGREICEMVEIDAFDMRDIISQILAVRRRPGFSDAEIHVNITGGTNIMASAALVACFTIGARAYYLRENVGGATKSLVEFVITLPVPKVPLDSLSPAQRSILRHLRKEGGTLERANVSLQAALGAKSPQLVSYHLRKLRAKGLVELIAEGRQKTAFLTDAGGLYAELV